jgi:NADH-quinone oxidoreductase subunit C
MKGHALSAHKKSLSSFGAKVHCPLGELTVFVEAGAIVDFVQFLKSEPRLSFDQLLDVCGVDYWGTHKMRFEVVYHLLSLQYNHRLRIRVPLAEEEASLPSLTSLYPSAGWWEREAFDMFGIKFENHPDLKRILTDEHFDGFPLRKDFPLTGYEEVHYDNQLKKIVYGPAHFPQAYRVFDTTSPWEGIHETFQENRKKFRASQS